MSASRSSFGASVASGFVAGVASAVTLSAAAFLFQDPLAQYLSEIRPTCERPSGLVQVDPAGIEARGPVSTSHPFDRADPENVLDNDAGSLWIPRSVHPPGAHVAAFADNAARLRLKLPAVTELELVCVNNGLASSETAYQNYGKAKTVRSWTVGDASDAAVTTLSSQPSGSMQSLQVVGRNLAAADQVSLQVDDAYAGETVETFDPDHCGQPSEEVRVGPETPQLRYARGCIVAAAPTAGLSEVVLYEDADQTWAERWIPFWP